ncbi:MAG TPA: site-specific DNA-methyltransferase, partial [Bacteroidales bacterium]|nr:site-specific DNA-methyltransferase [Bacteroidales bacterium]
MAEKKEMKIAEVKGRPMLHWIGKQPLETVKSFPSQLVEKFNIDESPQVPTFESLKNNWTNLLFHGDNKEVLSTLLVNGFRGKIDLIYIDPPFDSGADYIRKVELRGQKEKIEGEEPSLIEQVQYTDIWANDNYLQFMYERFILLRELLSDRGSIYVHCDWHKGHHLRFLLDEVFGSENFRNEIIWCYYGPGSPGMQQFNRKHDNIFWYVKTNDWVFNGEDIRIPYHETTAKKFESEGTGFGGERELADGKIPEDWWPLPIVNRIRTEILNYPTQKPLQLIDKIISASSNEDSIVLDCFIGSGTSAASAQKLGRKWIGCDINKGAIQTTSKRLQSVIKEQLTEIEKEKSKLDLEEKKTYFTSFAHYKINDYDLQIQHNELKLLVYEHIGVKKLATDSFFDGTLGTELVKIIPFNHPLSL